MVQEQQSTILHGNWAGWRFVALVLVACCLFGYLGLRLWPSDPIVATVPLGAVPGKPSIDELTGHAFIPNYLDTNVEMLATSTGTLLRTLVVGSNGGAHPGAVRIDGPAHRVFVASDDGRLSAFDTRSGTPFLVATLGGSIQIMALDQRRHRLFVANPDTGALSIVNSNTGALLQVVSTGLSPQALVVDETTSRLFLASPSDRSIRVLDAATGALLRVIRLNMQPQALLVDEPLGLVFVASADGATVTVLDALSGKPLRAAHLGALNTLGHLPLLAAANATGRLFVASGSSVRLLDLRSGRLLRVVKLRSPVTAMADYRQSHTCLVVTQGSTDGAGRLVGRGAVAVLDDGSGEVRRTLTVGVGPRFIAVDAPHRRALVVNTGLNPDSSFARIPLPDSTWIQRLPWIGSIIPWSNQAQMPSNGRGSVTLLDLSRL